MTDQATAVGRALAMRVLQSDLYFQLDEVERGECDALIHDHLQSLKAPSQPAAPAVDSVTITLQQFDALRVALEVIAVGDSKTPSDTAAHGLVAAGLWTDALETSNRAVAGASKPVATLHDDGHWTWNGTPPHESNYAGWRMDVYAGSPSTAAQGATLDVWYGPMPESNGKTNWTVILHKGDVTCGITIDQSEYPDRVRYAADCVRWMIGELEDKPNILDYDADKHSGYVAPTPVADSGVIYQEQDGSGHWIDIPRIRYNMIPNRLWKRIVYTDCGRGVRHE